MTEQSCVRRRRVEWGEVDCGRSCSGRGGLRCRQGERLQLIDGARRGCVSAVPGGGRVWRRRGRVARLRVLLSVLLARIGAIERHLRLLVLVLMQQILTLLALLIVVVMVVVVVVVIMMI